MNSNPWNSRIAIDLAKSRSRLRGMTADDIAASKPRFERVRELPGAGQTVWYYPGATTAGGAMASWRGFFERWLLANMHGSNRLLYISRPRPVQNAGRRPRPMATRVSPWHADRLVTDGLFIEDFTDKAVRFAESIYDEPIMRG